MDWQRGGGASGAHSIAHSHACAGVWRWQVCAFGQAKRCVCPACLAVTLTCPPTRLQVRLLDVSGRDPQLRLRAANLLGLLIRHAASISPALVNAGEPPAAALLYAQGRIASMHAAALLRLPYSRVQFACLDDDEHSACLTRRTPSLEFTCQAESLTPIDLAPRAHLAAA